MQSNMQQIPQPQIIIQNPQMVMAYPQQMQPQNQLYQVVQTNSTPNRCEKFSQWMTGTRNIPLMVFLIFMANSANFIVSLLSDTIYFAPISTFSSLGNFLFALFVWLPMAVKIEKNTTTTRYGYLYLINCSLLSIFSFGLPLALNKIWCFVLFETLLIALSNKDKKMKFFCGKISGKVVIILTIVYHLFFNWYYSFAVIVTIVYTFAYRKYLINKFGASNERVERLENWCCVNWLKNNLTTFVTLKEVLEKGQQQQPLVQNSNLQNSNNSSFIPVNIYPNYNSGVAPNMQQMESMPQSNELRTVDSNVSQPSQ